MKRNWLMMLALLLTLGLVLAACSGGDDAGTEGEGTEDTEGEGGGEAANDGEPQEGGTVTGAMYSAPSGLFNPIFYTETYENNILSFTHESLVSQNDNLEFEPQLATKWEKNEDQTEITFTLEEGVKWHDGEEFTAEDVVFTYKAMSDPEYTAAGGVRTEYVKPLVGYEAYSSGETDEFQGVVAEGDYTVTFKFAEPNVNPLYYAGFPIIPEHVFADIPVSEMPDAPESRDPDAVIGTGPFKFTEMVEREQYVLEANEDYWQGSPYLDQVVWKVIDQSVMTGLLETGEIDMVPDPDGVPAADLETVSGFGNIEIIKQPDFGFQLLGLKHNYRTTEDVENGVINPDNFVPNEDLADKEVRQAIAYAINRQGIIEGLLYGEGQVINSPIAPQFWAYDEEAATDYSYDPEQAKALLDEAGYVDTNDDGFRENPDGEEWILDMEYPTGNKLRERSAPIIEEQLEAVGINVDLGQPKEFTAYAEELELDNNDWDLYLLGWSLSSGDPDPTGLWGSDSAYNYSRWNNPKSDELLQQAMQAPEAFDQEYRTEVYSEWQKLFSEDLPALLLYAQNSLWAYNDRLNGVDPLPYSMINDTHEWWVDDAE